MDQRQPLAWIKQKYKTSISLPKHIYISWLPGLTKWLNIATLENKEKETKEKAKTNMQSEGHRQSFFSMIPSAAYPEN